MTAPSPASRLRTPSLAFRLTAWYAGSAFLLLLLATGVLYRGLVASLNLEDDKNLANEVKVLRNKLRLQPDDSAVLQQEVVQYAGSETFSPVLVRLLDGRGGTVIETPRMGPVLPPGAFPAVPPGADATGFAEITGSNGEAFRVITADVSAGRPPGASKLDVRLAQVALDHSAEENLLAIYRRRLLAVLGTGLFGCAIVGYVIARRGIRPITGVAQTVRRIGSASLHQRIDATGFPSELTALATTLNGMLDRLEDAFARLTRFSGDIAHELRTPINILRGEAEVALTKDRPPEHYRDVLASSLEECGRLTRLIDRLLFLARAESPAAQVRREKVDVRAELASLREFYEAAAGEAGVQLLLEDGGAVPPPDADDPHDPDEGDGAAPAPGADPQSHLTSREREGAVFAPETTPLRSPLVRTRPEAVATSATKLEARLDRTLFQRAVGNLVENALRHTPAGGRVSVGARRDGGLLRVEVADTGAGIPPGELPYVFNRFHRVDESRSKGTGGAGLGLAIVKTIATLHGGSVQIESELNAGTRVSLLFPDGHGEGEGAAG